MDMGNADASSRLPVDRPPNIQEVACITVIDAHQLPITSQQIALYTRKDPLLSKVLSRFYLVRMLLSQAEVNLL